MTVDARTPGIPLSPPATASFGGGFSSILRSVRGLFLGRRYDAAVSDIETAFGVSRRTAERIYAGQPVSGDTTLRLIFNETSGPPILQEGLARLPLERRLIVAEKIRDAAELVHLQTKQELLVERMTR